jgi:ribonuclease BN (tRNA processing enzyme)
MEKRLEVKVLGVGDAFTTEHNHAGLLVKYGTDYLLVDCQPRILCALKDAGVMDALPSINACVFTHGHSDHAGGLEQFVLYKNYVERSTPPTLVTPPGVLDTAQYDGKSIDTLARRVALPAGKAYQYGPFGIETYQTSHSNTPSVAVKIRAGGYTLGYTGDTKFDWRLIGWLNDCDMVFHDVNGRPGHAAYEELAKIHYDFRRRTYGIHYSDDFKGATNKLRLAEEGKTYVVPGRVYK